MKQSNDYAQLIKTLCIGTPRITQLKVMLTPPNPDIGSNRKYKERISKKWKKQNIGSVEITFRPPEGFDAEIRLDPESEEYLRYFELALTDGDVYAYCSNDKNKTQIKRLGDQSPSEAISINTKNETAYDALIYYAKKLFSIK